MASTRYYTVDGRILGQKATGGSRTDYVRDGLGSVVATTDSSGSVVNTYRYKPYGSPLSKTGAGADPRFQWGGQWGYRNNNNTSAYVRLRHLNTAISSWDSIDVLWPGLSAYAYVGSNPIRYVDPLGLAPCEAGADDCCCCPLGGKVTPKHAKGHDPIPGAPQYVADSWRGHEVAFSFSLKYFKVKKGDGGDCTPDDQETIYVDGEKHPRFPWVGSWQEQQWNKCLSRRPKSCNGTIPCTIVDRPGTTPYLLNPVKRVPTKFKLFKVLTIKGGSKCKCKDVVMPFNSLVWWKKTYGEPDPWTP